MMVSVLPMSRSLKFIPTDIVSTTISTTIRLGPGTNYAIMNPPDIIEPDQRGVVQPHGSVPNGVLATGSNWWKVDFSGVVGWVREDNLFLVERSQTIDFFNSYLPSLNGAD